MLSTVRLHSDDFCSLGVCCCAFHLHSAVLRFVLSYVGNDFDSSLLVTLTILTNLNHHILVDHWILSSMGVRSKEVTLKTSLIGEHAEGAQHAYMLYIRPTFLQRCQNTM